MSRRLSLALLLAVPALGATAASAQTGRVLVESPHPYWEVGALDPVLSTDCARGNFNQREPNKLKMVFNGPIGPAILGVATDVYNLYDPKRQAKKETSFFFFRDKTGACEVYRFTKGDEKKKQGALPMDFSPYRSLIEDAYTGWRQDESVKNRPPAAAR